MARLLIVGGSDAGISAGLRAHQLDAQLDVTLLLADRFPNYSICGLPFYISGETPDWRALAHRQVDDLQRGGLHLLSWERRLTALQTHIRVAPAVANEPGGAGLRDIGPRRPEIGTIGPRSRCS